MSTPLGRAREWTPAFSRVGEREPESGGDHGRVPAWIGPRSCSSTARGRTRWRRRCLACERSGQAAPQASRRARYRQAEMHRLAGEFAKADEAYRAASRQASNRSPDWRCSGSPRAAPTRRARPSNASSAPTSGSAGARDAAARLPRDHAGPRAGREEAREACGELHAIAEMLDSDLLRAAAVQSKGALALAEGEARTALGPLRAAFDALGTTRGAVPESARVRVLLGLACQALGDEDAGALEHDAAKVIFERLGARARPDASRARSAANRAPGRSLHPLTTASVTCFDRIALGRHERVDRRRASPERANHRPPRQQYLSTSSNVPSRDRRHRLRLDRKIL